MKPVERNRQIVMKHLYGKNRWPKKFYRTFNSFKWCSLVYRWDICIQLITFLKIYDVAKVDSLVSISNGNSSKSIPSSSDCSNSHPKLFPDTTSGSESDDGGIAGEEAVCGMGALAIIAICSRFQVQDPHVCCSIPWQERDPRVAVGPSWSNLLKQLSILFLVLTENLSNLNISYGNNLEVLSYHLVSPLTVFAGLPQYI